MELIGLGVQWASGALAGVLAGSRLARASLGRAGDMLAGAIGGGIGVAFADAWLGLAPTAAPDTGTVVVQAAGGALAGAAMMLAAGLLVSRATRPDR
jgi:hypothetical protein